MKQITLQLNNKLYETIRQKYGDPTTDQFQEPNIWLSQLIETQRQYNLFKQQIRQIVKQLNENGDIKVEETIDETEELQPEITRILMEFQALDNAVEKVYEENENMKKYVKIMFNVYAKQQEKLGT